MKSTALVSLFLLISIWTHSQESFCVTAGDEINLNNLNFEDCSGALTYDITNSSTGLNCTDCDFLIYPTGSESITVTAYDSDGDECDQLSVSITFLTATISFINSSSPDCNEFTFEADVSNSVSNYSWDFDNDGSSDSSNPNPTWTFESNGNQNVVLTVSDGAGECSYTTSVNLTVDGPWAELVISGNPDGDDDYEVFDLINFNNNACTVPFCVDDVDDTHCLVLTDFPHANAAGNNLYEIWIDNANIYSSAAPPLDLSYCFPPAFSGYATLDYQITDQNGCEFLKSYQVYIAEYIFPVELVEIIDPDLQGNCVGDVLEFVVTADPINPEDVTYIVAIDCSNQNFFELEPLFLDTLYLAPGESVDLSWEVNTSSCFCDFPYQFSIYTYGSNPCTGNPIASNTAPFSVRLDTEADFNAPDILCENDQYSFNWQGGEFIGSNICDVDIDWSLTEPDNNVITGISDDTDFTWTFDQAGEYEVCLLIDSDCSDNDSEICETICVEAAWGNADLTMDWPVANNEVHCPGYTYSPTALIDVPLCTPLVYQWTVSPNVGYSVVNNDGGAPTFTFNQKGNYTIYFEAESTCGFASSNYSTISIGGPPTVQTILPSIGGCPGESICLDGAFCVDDCNAPFTTATLSIYEEAPGLDCAVNGALQWEASGNPLISFPVDMTGLDCNPNSSICDFLWDVPDGLEGTFMAVLEVVNACGADLNCIQINVSPPNIPDVDFATEYCSGETLNPNLTNFSTCTWSDEIGVIWQPGWGDIVMSNGFTLSISCSSSGCPFTISEDIIVNPLPAVTIDGNPGLCAGGSTLLSSNTAVATSNWYNTSCAFISGGTAIDFTGTEYEVSNPGTYSVVVIDANGCSNCAEINVNLDQSPNFNCFLDSYCESDEDQTIDLSCLTAPPNGWGANPVAWNVDLDDVSIDEDILLPYSVSDLLTAYPFEINSNTDFEFSYSWTSDLGCLYVDTFNIEIQNEGVNHDTLEVCTEEELFINPFVNGLWDIIDMPVSAGEDYTGTNFNWTPELTDAGGFYSLEFYPDGGCSFDSILVFVNLGPTTDINIISDNASSTICQGETVQLQADPGYDYQWYSGNSCDFFSTILFANEQTLDVDAPGDYSVLITDDSDCSFCQSINIVMDQAPNFICDDIQFCENQPDAEIDLNCLSEPGGGWQNAGPTWSLSQDGTIYNPDLSTSNYSVSDLIGDYGSEITENSSFQLIYEWTSEAQCFYSDSLDFTILNEGIDTTYTEICSGEIIDLIADGSTGIWTYNSISPTADYTEFPTSINWETDVDDTGSTWDLFFTSDAGCSSFQFYVNVFETPEGSITPDLIETCEEGSVDFVLDSGISTNQTLEYIYDVNTILLDENNETFAPLDYALTYLDDGELAYTGNNQYTLIDDAILLCSFTDTIEVNILDYPASLAFPPALCEGDEFEPAVCIDGYIDSFELTIDGEIYDSCPLEFGTLNGEVDYTVEAFYGGDLNCSISEDGQILIQEQLELSFTYSIDSCTAEAVVDFEILGGVADQIIFDPGGIFTDNLLNQSLILPFDPDNDESFDFNISVDDGGCDTQDFSMEGIYIAPLNPTIIIESGPFCSGQSIQFDLVQTGSSQLDSIIVDPGNDIDPIYTWIDDNYIEGVEFIYESPLDSSQYEIGFHLFNLCHDTILTDTFIVEPPQLIAFMDAQNSSCPGNLLDLDPTINGSYTDYDIIVPPELSLTLDNINEPFIFLVDAGQEPGIFEIEIIFDADCGDTISIFTEVEIYPTPEAEIQSIIQCSGLNSQFNILNSSIQESYEWTIDGQSFFGTTVNYVFNQTGDYPIVLEISNQLGCSNVQNFNVTVSGVESILPFEPIAQCEDLDLSLGVDINANLNVHWTITNNLNNDQQEYFVNFQTVNFFNTSNEYSIVYQVQLEISDNTGCSSYSNSTVEIYPDGTAQIEYLINDTSWVSSNEEFEIRLNEVCSEEEFRFRDATASNACGWSTTINTCPFGPISSCPEFIICANADDDGDINLTTINEYGCYAYDSLHVVTFCGDDAIFYVPNAFTPDFDGVNDVFLISGTNFNPDEFELLIFDRWGEVVFKTNDINEPWLGEHNDGEYFVMDDVYNYLITTYVKGLPLDKKNRRKYRGHITIIR